MKHIRILVLILALVATSIWVLATKEINGKPWNIKRGLDLAGGTSITLQAETDKLPAGQKWTAEHQKSIIRIIENRINGLGVTEPLIQPKGTDQVIVELPDIKNEDDAIRLLQSTARMEFRDFRNVKSERFPMAKYRMDVSTDEEGNDVYTFSDAQGNEVKADKVINEAPLILTGNDLRPNASADKDTQSFEPLVNLQFTQEGKEKFREFTTKNVGNYLAIVLEGKVLSVPTIRVPILDGKGQISGGFKSLEEAQSLAEYLNAGALPVPLQIAQIQKVEATLGSVSVDKSMMAGIIGLVAVILFMLGYYLLPGLIADVALCIYALLTLAAFKVLGITLTLPGIAAFILSIGMAVDANILIFERLKEELRSGKTLRAAIDAGFSRAFTSIFDSNMCTAITCVILMIFGTGPIRGFAVVLLLSVAISMFTAITATRTILYMLVNTGMANNPILFGVGRQWVTGKTGTRQVNIVGKMMLWFGLSAAILIPGMIFLGMGGLKQGIDFTGGSLMQVKFNQTVDKAAINGTLDKFGLTNSMIQQSTDDPTVAFIRTKQAPHSTFVQVRSELETQGGTIQSESQVGATVSSELTKNAIMAVIFASLAIVLYLSIRFSIGGLAAGFRFGTCAIIATLHDVLLIIGIFAILGHVLGWEIDSLFVTALLTIIGFSTHDTIVIFDRIRENLRHKQRGEAFDDLVNRSILQSFARSINTSLTVVITLVALLIFGAHNIQHFVVALLVGVVTGTYSSIFNASQLLVLWNRIAGQKSSAPVVAETAPTRTQKAREMKPVAAGVSAKPSASAETEEAAVSEADLSAEAKAKLAAKRRKRRF